MVYNFGRTRLSIHIFEHFSQDRRIEHLVQLGFQQAGFHSCSNIAGDGNVRALIVPERWLSLARWYSSSTLNKSQCRVTCF